MGKIKQKQKLDENIICDILHIKQHYTLLWSISIEALRHIIMGKVTSLDGVVDVALGLIIDLQLIYRVFCWQLKRFLY